MIVEYVRYRIEDAAAASFERAYEQAAGALEASPHCLGYDLARCVDDPTQYVLRIEWDSAEGHMQGFRSSPQFGQFFALVKPFVDQIEEMRHYQPTPIASRPG
jgi:quinol monooxygenase YgiN